MGALEDAQLMGRAARQDVPFQGAPDRRQVSRHAAAREWLRHALRLQAPAQPDAAWLPEHGSVPGLGSARLPLPDLAGGPQFLRPRAGEAARDGVEQPADLPEAEECDPPSPQPWRCFDLGRASAQAMAASPWRVALVASSSWSHSFLTSNSWYTHPDVEADKRYYEALVAGDWNVWRETPLEQAEASGHHELLNWFCLAGAMSELDRKPSESRFLESWLCNSDKVFAVFRP